MLGLNQQEFESLSIVAVAANPFDKGLEHWLLNIEEFKSLSHIEKLQEATNSKIKMCGGTDHIDYAMKASIISDVLVRQLPVARETNDLVTEEVAKLDILQSRLKSQLLTTEQQITITRANLRDFVVNYFTDLIMQVKGCSMETLGNFIDREIGSSGSILNHKLQQEFENQMGPITLTVNKMNANFDGEVGHFNATIRTLGKEGVSHALKGNLINNHTIIATRDGIVSVAKSIGFDIGKSLNFKPWGAVNLAKGLNGVLSAFGVALELWDTYDRIMKQKKFNEAISTMVNNFETQRSELLELISADEFKQNFFPAYSELINKLDELESNLLESKERQHAYLNWLEEGESIHKDFLTLPNLN